MKRDDQVLKKYGDIMNLTRPISKKHQPMSLRNRAAQFAPFAALTGYDQALAEKARLTDHRPVLSEEKKTQINDMLQQVFINITNTPDIRVSYFEPDAKKAGGKIITLHAFVRKMSVDERYIMLKDKQRILFDDILDVQILDTEE
ncbi:MULTISPECIES: hypothetical protein [unclassified Breznakia]|uniref:hypothetical protein n=1 Tax=unclassified Breznakia TaxID=2623764 RepID=UPI002473D15E|nr:MULTISPECIES: hypothetical protein [unclassified Breznakia]MDH6366808.1 hypothetical protein [Breznakia sp. PH1-1]MDH6403805.1 hypothetical protein [Breznakia sp. PF1-11]MDH6411514.1 hypothetical protein [Breznakia sp. PFB1-11]MDH6413878.1 hypothetical protein [Breznakia sp. PFB1-14]MDH6416307.1 hypothetical protein [Breznakia sp. PFB1-4]